MARFGKLLPPMWDEDEDFLALGADAKYVYNFLLGQRDLGHSGIITLRVESWARRLSKSVAEVKAALKELHVERYVVIDAEELLLLVRSLIRRDEVYKQPNTFKSAANQIYGVRSQPIRRVLLTELERLEPAEMKGDSEAVRGEVIAWLRKTCESPPPNPSAKGSARGSAKGYDADPGHDSEFGQDFDVSADERGSAKGSAIPCENPQRVHVRVDARVAPTPTTTTTTTPTPLSPGALFELETVGTPAADKPQQKGRTRSAKPVVEKPPASAKDPEVEAREKLARDLTDEWWDGLDIKPAETNAWIATYRIFLRLLGVGHLPDAVADAARRSEFAINLKGMQIELKRIKQEAERRSSPHAIPGQRPTVDQRVMGTLAAAESLARELGEIPPESGDPPLATVTYLPLGELAS